MAKTLRTAQHKALIALLIAEREKTGLTQSGCATALGEYQSFVARLESGQRRVDVIELIQLSRVLKFDVPETVQELVQSSN